MKYSCLLLILLFGSNLWGQQTYLDEIKEFHNEQQRKFLNKEESPLPAKELKKFINHDYFPVNQLYQVKAKFIRFAKPETFLMKTSTSRLPLNDKYGTARFSLNGKQYELVLYQSHSSRESIKYRDYLFLPFTDLTNGEESYGGGRYVDVHIPKGDEIIIDFNKTYNPYCAYSARYSCPIPPSENDLAIRIEAGIKHIKASTKY